MADRERSYHPKDAVAGSINSAALAGFAGALMSAVQNSLARQNVGAMGFFTRTGGTIVNLGLAGGLFEFTRLASGNLRRTDDTWNTAIGGFFGGAVLGMRTRTLPATLGHGAALSVILAAFEYTGGSLRGYGKDPDVDEFERKEELRRNKRRPIQETIEELGEGRGIYGPGYSERRRERIKQAYGIDVPASG